jgi:hypothetical protein
MRQLARIITLSKSLYPANAEDIRFPDHQRIAKHAIKIYTLFLIVVIGQEV